MVKSKVWLVHTPKHDVSTATAYGELHYVNRRYVYPDELIDGRIPSSFSINIDDAVELFDPQHDYLLLAGDPLQLVTFAARLVGRYSKIRAIRYDRIADGYVAIDVGMSHGQRPSGLAVYDAAC